MTFAYVSGEPVLHDVSFVVEPGQRIEIPTVKADAVLDPTRLKLLTDWLGQVREKLGVDE